jgi:hypothetical protein
MLTTIVLDGKERNAAWTALSILSNIEGHLIAIVPPYCDGTIESTKPSSEYLGEFAALRDIAWSMYFLAPELYPERK